jgi:hypothetical protein
MAVPRWHAIDVRQRRLAVQEVSVTFFVVACLIAAVAREPLLIDPIL